MATITSQLLKKFADKFAAKCIEKFAKKTDIPTELPANGGDAETVGGHTVGTNVPADAKFTDTVYSHPTTAGNKHIPAGGSSGQILRWSEDGTAVWGADSDTTYAEMEGASASAAGTAGLVPAPAKGKQNAYLRGDGTWQEIKEATTEDIDAIIAGVFGEE